MPQIQTIRSTAKSWIWMVEDYALGAGFFTDAGVKVTANASGRGTNMSALIGAAVDVEWGDPGEALNAKKENLAFRTIAQTVGRFGSHVVVKQAVLAKLGLTEASPAAAKIAALKGLRMGDTGPGGAPDNLLRWLAVKGGMNPDRDLRLVPIQGGGPAIVAALSQGVIDGFCLSSPHVRPGGAEVRLRLSVQHGDEPAAGTGAVHLHHLQHGGEDAARPAGRPGALHHRPGAWR